MADKEEAAGGETRKLIAGTALARILKKSRDAKKETSEINSKFRDALKKIYADDTVRSKTAMSYIQRLDRMEPEDLALFFEDFDHMCDVGGLRERAESATGDMFDASGEGEGDGADEGEKPKPRARKPRKGAEARQPAEVPG